MRKGFTLIELMIVVVIIGILAAIAIPKFSQVNDQARRASCRANLHSLAVTEAIYFSWYDAFATVLTSLDQIQDLSSLLRCPTRTSAGGYVIAIPGNNEYTVTCPVNAATQHGSIETGMASW
jgi:prepilin-type N-terminal cleavage/methylation domain-containing protein